MSRKSNEAVRLFQSGMSRKEIAEELGVSYFAVQKWLMGMSATDPVRFLPKSLMEDWDKTTAWIRGMCRNVGDR